MRRENLRNVAIIAHVDHGKTTLVDEMLKQSGVFRENQVVQERVMDSGDLERERGITILAKNTSVRWGDCKINIVDTPGHADFGGEVERSLKMVSGVLLLVDAFEGPMPQTRFVLQKALELGHKVILVVNKIDRPDARPGEVEEEVLELLLDLDATEEQLDSPVVYCSGRNGTASLTPYEPGTDLTPLFDKIIEHIDPPELQEGPTQLLVSSIDYNEYVGRIAIGRIERGEVKTGQEVAVCDYHEPTVSRKAKIVTLYQFEGLARKQVDSAISGDIVAFSGIDDINIGNTVCDPSAIEPLAFVKISEPTVEMLFSVNNSPFAGREGKFVTSRQLRDRLYRELLRDVSLHVEDGDTAESFRVLGRGEMHLSILIETMRREGYELQVGPPHVLYKEENGELLEPMEMLTVDVPESVMGSVLEKMGSRKGEILKMSPVGSRMRIEIKVPERGLFGYRSEFMTDTKGEGVFNTLFYGYEPYKGKIPMRASGSLIAFESGDSVTYGLYNAQERGDLFIGPGVPVYAGMVVGSSPNGKDIAVNVCKRKHVTNMRASGSDEALRLTPPRLMSLEDCLEYLAEDEMLEVTPKSLRIRKRMLDHAERMRERKASETD